MTDSSKNSHDLLRASGWSNRTLIASVAGILLLTLYPFRIGLNGHLYGPVLPFFLDGWGKNAGIPDALLNVLLFVPYGFGLALRARKKGRSRAATLGLCLVGGVLLSYTVELLQFYIPSRDSGWEDVFTNSSGSVVGFLLFELCGTFVLGLLCDVERTIDAWLGLGRSVLVFALYLGLWFALSLMLARQVRLSGWQPGSVLVVGNRISAESRSGWKGQVYQLELWDHALVDRVARTLTSHEPADPDAPSPVAEYDFTDWPPLPDQRHILPDLDWTDRTRALNPSSGLVLNGESPLVSRGPVSALVSDLQTAQQFTVRVVCKPTEVSGADARIVSIEQPSGPADLELRQEGPNLVVWFRTPISSRRSSMSWHIPNIFEIDQSREVLVSYDGSDLAVYVDGNKVHRSYELGPGVVLAQFVRRFRATESQRYQYIFYALVFFPAGWIAGLGWRKLVAQPTVRLAVATLAVLLPPLLFASVAKGEVRSVPNVTLWMVILLAGGLWINADRRPPESSLGSNTPHAAQS
jgi:VanZ like family